MPPEPDTERLDERRYVTVVLRLVLDRQEQLLYGEVADATGKPWCRFANWRELSKAVQTLISDR